MRPGIRGALIQSIVSCSCTGESTAAPSDAMPAIIAVQSVEREIKILIWMQNSEWAFEHVKHVKSSRRVTIGKRRSANNCEGKRFPTEA